MRKIILSVLCLYLFMSAHAQLSKGEKMLGGELQFESSKNKNIGLNGTKFTSFSIAPQIGFGLQKNWIVGAGIGYAYQKEEQGMGDQEVNVFSFGAFVRKFHPFNDRFGIYGQLDAGAGFGKSKSNLFTDESDVSLFTADIKPGFYFRATKRIIFEANFGGLAYTNTTIKPGSGSKSKSSTFGFTLGSTIGLSFQVVL